MPTGATSGGSAGSVAGGRCPVGLVKKAPLHPTFSHPCQTASPTQGEPCLAECCTLATPPPHPEGPHPTIQAAGFSRSGVSVAAARYCETKEFSSSSHPSRRNEMKRWGLPLKKEHEDHRMGNSKDSNPRRMGGRRACRKMIGDIGKGAGAVG